MQLIQMSNKEVRELGSNAFISGDHVTTKECLLELAKRGVEKDFLGKSLSRALRFYTTP